MIQVTDKMIEDFKDKYRDLWPGSWPDTESSRELLTAAVSSVSPPPPQPISVGWENEEKLTVEQAWTILCETPDITSPEEYPDHALITMEQLGSFMARAIPVGTIACPCTTFEQDEACSIGSPSLLCSACDGKGIAPVDKVVALAAEMMKVAEQVDELEDPFAAWETIDLLKSQRSKMIEALRSAEIKLARYMEVHGKDGTYIGGLAAEYDASLVVVRAALTAAEASDV